MSSLLEKRFDALWRSLSGPALQAELRFHPVRRWRFDRACTAAKVAIELEGGIWHRGRHTRGKGYEEDCIKYHAATSAGWSIFRLTGRMLTPDFLKPIIALCAKDIPCDQK